MRRLLALLPLLLFLSARPAHAQLANAQGWCESGATVVISSGLQSTNQVQGSFPSCTVSVSIHGGGTATIFSTGSSVPLSNPFTAQSNGRWIFYAANGEYDITMTGGGLTSPVTYSDVFVTNVTSGGGGGGTPCVTTANSFQYNNAGAFGCAAGVTTPDAGNSVSIKGPAPRADVTAFGARAVTVVPSTTATCTATQTSVTLASASTFRNGDGITLYGCGPTLTLGTPAAPSVTPSVAIEGTGLGGGTVTKSVVASGTGSSAYSYEVIYRDAVGGFTAPSSATMITNGLSAIGPQTCTITTATRSNASVTVNLSSACAGAVAGARVQLTGQSTSDFNGWYNISTVNSSTQIVINNTPIDSRSEGWLPTDSASSTGGTLTAYFSNHLNLTFQTGMWEAYICAERPGDGSFSLIGYTQPSSSISGWRDIQFDDYGVPYNSNQTYPSYITNSLCNGGSARNDPLTTTIVSGAGTTSIVVANAAINNSSGLTAIFDDGPGFTVAASSITQAIGLAGRMLIPTPTTAGASYVINSYTNLVGNIVVEQAGSMTVNETIQINGMYWRCNLSDTGPAQFATIGYANIGIGSASPGIYSIGSNVFDHCSIGTGHANGGIVEVSDQPGIGEEYQHSSINVNSGTGDYLGMGLVFRMTDPAGETKFVFVDSYLANPLPSGTPLSPPLVYVPPGQNGSGGVQNTVAHFEFINTNFAIGGIEWEGCNGAPNVQFIGNRNVRQGGDAPLFTMGNCGGGTVSNITFDGVTEDTDTQGLINIENTGGQIAPLLRFEDSLVGSVPSGGNGANPPLTGYLPAASQVITGPGILSGRTPTMLGYGSCPNTSLGPYMFCMEEPELVNAPNGYIFSPLASPTSPSGSTAAGGSITAETLQFAITAVDINGKETIQSPLTSSVTTDPTCPGSGNCSVNLSWSAPTTSVGSVTYNIYECGQSSVCPSMRLTHSGATGTSITLTSIGAGSPPPALTQAGQMGLSPTQAWAPTDFSNLLNLTEVVAPTGIAGTDQLYGDSTAHRLKQCNNNTACDTVVGAATTDILTHKTYDTAGTGNVLKINGNAVSAVTGNTSSVQLQSGATTTGDAVKFDANGNTVDAGFVSTLIICTGQIALTTGAIGSGARATNTLSCSGLSATTDSITCTFSGDTNAVTGYAPSASGGLSLKTWASTNTINVDQVNDTGGSITPGAATINCKGIR